MNSSLRLVADALPPATLATDNGKYLSWALTLLVHLLLFGLLFFGIRWTTNQQDVIEVELVSAVSTAPEPPPPAPRPAPAQPLTPRTPVAPEPPPVPKAEHQPALSKPDIALKDEKQKPKLIKPAEPPRERLKEPPKTPAKEPPKPVEKHTPKKPQSSPADQTLDQQLEQELKQMQHVRRTTEASRAASDELAQLQAEQAARSRAVDGYISKIRAKIKGNLILPADLPGNPEAIFAVTQLPSGEILSVRLQKTSGYAAYDTAVERAIRKSSPLPKPEQNELFARELTLKFRPLED